MSQTIQIECPNCQTINNVKREEPLTDGDDVMFDCGKCGQEVTLECNINYEEFEEEQEEL